LGYDGGSSGSRPNGGRGGNGIIRISW
jgi:hypothetical protein